LMDLFSFSFPLSILGLHEPFHNPYVNFPVISCFKNLVLGACVDVVGWNRLCSYGD
jgi:hypothetical protein